MTLPTKTFDVLVVGAGPAGSSAARLLARGGAKVILVDPQRQQSHRLELVGPRALPTFEDMGLSHALSDENISHPCLGIRKIWGRGVHIDEFIWQPGGRGYVVDRTRFDAELLRMARDERIQSVQGTVTTVRVSGGTVVAEVGSSGTSAVRAALVVDATGRSASISRRLGAKRRVHEHLLASSDDKPEDEALAQSQWLDVMGNANGWQYVLLGPGGRHQLWSVHRGRGTSTRNPLCQKYCDASSASLDHCAGTHWIAIGDAAAAYDPITSQGLVTALASARAASSLVLGGSASRPDAQREFSALVARTHARSEAGRQALYAVTA